MTTKLSVSKKSKKNAQSSKPFSFSEEESIFLQKLVTLSDSSLWRVRGRVAAVFKFDNTNSKTAGAASKITKAGTPSKGANGKDALSKSQYRDEVVRICSKVTAWEAFHKLSHSDRLADPEGLNLHVGVQNIVQMLMKRCFDISSHEDFDEFCHVFGQRGIKYNLDTLRSRSLFADLFPKQPAAGGGESNERLTTPAELEAKASN